MELKIVEAVNGFVVYVNSGQGLVEKIWAFESPATLAKFVHDWAEEMKES